MPSGIRQTPFVFLLLRLKSWYSRAPHPEARSCQDTRIAGSNPRQTFRPIIPEANPTSFPWHSRSKTMTNAFLGSFTDLHCFPKMQAVKKHRNLLNLYSNLCSVYTVASAVRIRCKRGHVLTPWLHMPDLAFLHRTVPWFHCRSKAQQNKDSNASIKAPIASLLQLLKRTRFSSRILCALSLCTGSCQSTKFSKRNKAGTRLQHSTRPSSNASGLPA